MNMMKSLLSHSKVTNFIYTLGVGEIGVLKRINTERRVKPVQQNEIKLLKDQFKSYTSNREKRMKLFLKTMKGKKQWVFLSVSIILVHDLNEYRTFNSPIDDLMTKDHFTQRMSTFKANRFKSDKSLKSVKNMWTTNGWSQEKRFTNFLTTRQINDIKPITLHSNVNKSSKIKKVKMSKRLTTKSPKTIFLKKIDNKKVISYDDIVAVSRDS